MTYGINKKCCQFSYFFFLFCIAMLVLDHLAREGSFSNRYCLFKRIRNQKILLSSKSLWVLYLLFLDCLGALYVFEGVAIRLEW